MNGRARVGWLSLGLCLVVLAAPAWAGTKDIRVQGKTPAAFMAEQVGQSHAVVIGIDDYEHVRPLHYAVADAKAMAQTLKQRGFLVTEIYNKDASRRHILGELGDKLVDRVGPNDRVLIFYSGHGETKQPKGGKEMGFLLPVGAEADALAETAIPMSLIRDLADALPSKHVLFLVDVCYGGVAGTQFKSVLKYDAAYLQEITRERGRQLITAGGPKQEALEGPEWGHSVFTYYLLEGLNRGLADLDGDGIIPASELHQYLDRRVFDAAQTKGHKQRPEMWKLASEPGEFVFFTSATGKTGPAQSRPPAPVFSAPTLSAPAPSAALSPAEQELLSLEAQEQAMEAQGHQVDLQAQVAEKKRQLAEKQRQLDEKQKKLEVASLPTYSAPKELGRAITGKDGAPMLLVPEGEFLYGENKQRLSLSAFYMDKFEVSTAQYAKHMGATGATAPGEWPTSVLVSQGQKPVVGVSWHEAAAYCRAYGKRLPTEQEWEKAARGTDGRIYPWGNEEPTSRHAKYDLDGKATWNGYVMLATVESYEAGQSPYGLYHMAGNVWEWTSSDYDGESKVLRGGSWLNDAVYLRATLRLSDSPSYRSYYMGFRCAQDRPN